MLSWFCLVLGGTGQHTDFMPGYIEKSGDLVECHQCITLTHKVQAESRNDIMTNELKDSGRVESHRKRTKVKQ